MFSKQKRVRHKICVISDIRVDHRGNAGRSSIYDRANYFLYKLLWSHQRTIKPSTKLIKNFFYLPDYPAVNWKKKNFEIISSVLISYKLVYQYLKILDNLNLNINLYFLKIISFLLTLRRLRLQRRYRFHNQMFRETRERWVDSVCMIVLYYIKFINC